MKCKPGALYSCRVGPLYLLDSKTKKQCTLQKGDIVTVIDIWNNYEDPVVLVNDSKYHLNFDYYHGDSFETFFEEIKTDEIQS